MQANWLSLKFYIGTYIIRGSVEVPINTRIIDFLNGKTESNATFSTDFIEVKDATVSYASGIKERQQSTHINKSAILMVETEDSDSARGIGGKAGYKGYPYIEKTPVQVILRMPGYKLLGHIHCASTRRVGDVLSKSSIFMPLTEVKIRSEREDIWQTASFTALNRMHIYSLQEQESNMY
jgi:hypothetical protein